MILHTNKNLSHIYSQIKTFIQELWNYGLEISQSVHTLDSCKQFANENISFMSSILDARVITRRRTKKPNLFELKNIFLLPSRFFKEAKIKEMTSRWIKYGTPYFKQNPHIKNNPGSLRDIQTLYLLEKYSKTAPVIDNSSEIISSARNFLALLRFTLHLYHRRNANQLHKEKQKTIASTLKVSEKTDLLKLYHEKTAPLIRLIRELGLQGIL